MNNKILNFELISFVQNTILSTMTLQKYDKINNMQVKRERRNE